ncbi:MAG: hypothetical protein M3Q81_02315 [bacterium]|nr:hypothetical protein [bacterium]
MNRSFLSRSIVTLGIGVGLGWLLKDVYNSPAFKEQKAAIEQRYLKLKELLEDSHLYQPSDGTSNVYSKARNQLAVQLANIFSAVKSVDTQKYQAEVTELVTSIAADEGLSESQLKRLNKELLKDAKKVIEQYQEYQKVSL